MTPSFVSRPTRLTALATPFSRSAKTAFSKLPSEFSRAYTLLFDYSPTASRLNRTTRIFSPTLPANSLTISPTDEELFLMNGCSISAI